MRCCRRGCCLTRVLVWRLRRSSWSFRENQCSSQERVSPEASRVRPASRRTVSPEASHHVFHTFLRCEQDLLAWRGVARLSAEDSARSNATERPRPGDCRRRTSGGSEARDARSGRVRALDLVSLGVLEGPEARHHAGADGGARPCGALRGILLVRTKYEVTHSERGSMSIHSEKHAIVLEVGSRYVKCGLSEERAPRSVLRWEVAELLAKRASAAEYHAYLVPQLHRICFDLLHVNPRHRRFLVCEDVVTPRAFREALVAVVFNELKAASLTLVPSAITALYATSHHTALIVDCGWAETRVLPVYKGIPLQYLYTTASVGASTGCQVIQSALASDDDEKMSLEAAEDVLERACFVQPHKNPIMDIVDARFGGTGDNALVVPAHVRTDACECLFRGTTDSDITVLSCVQEALEKLPIDVRVAMVENLLVLGGTAMLPGFCRRLVDEIRDGLMMEKQGWGDRAALVQPLFPRNMLAWVGASIYASTEAAREHAISSNDFASRGSQCLPDWMSIAEKNI